MLRIYGADVMSEKENYILCVLQIKAMLRERLYGKIKIEHGHKNGWFENYNCLKCPFLGALTPTKAIATVPTTTATTTTTTTTIRSKPFL